MIDKNINLVEALQQIIDDKLFLLQCSQDIWDYKFKRRNGNIFKIPKYLKEEHIEKNIKFFLPSDVTELEKELVLAYIHTEDL